MFKKMENLTVQVNYDNGDVGTYVCPKRPYFNYDNNTADLTLADDKGKIVINMDKVTSITY